MLFDGDVLQIDAEEERLDALRAFVSTRLEYISEIRVDGGGETIPHQRLLQLLGSIKKSRPQIKIPLLDEQVRITSGGTARWILG